MNKDNENTPDKKPLTRGQRILLDVMMKRKKSKEAEQPTYLTEAHQKNSEAVMKEIAESKKSPTDWEEESKRQKWNSQNHSLDTN